MLITMKIKDNLKNHDICSFCKNEKGILAKKYVSGENFGVIEQIHGIYDDIGAVALDYIVKLRVPQDTVMGDILAEYKHKQLVKKYRKVAYIKRLIALEDGIKGDIIQAQIIY